MSGPSREYRKKELRAIVKAVETIHEAWPRAVDDANARGYSPFSPGLRSVSKKFPRGDPLHFHTMKGTAASSGRNAGSDPTFQAHLAPDIAGNWVREVDTRLGFFLTLGRIPLSQSHPATRLAALRDASVNIVNDWLPECPALLKEVHHLANMARKHWAPPLKPGDSAEGVTVGKRAQNVELCKECGGPVTGGKFDRIRRIDGAPYHEKPCFHTVRRRKQRRAERERRRAS